MSQIIKVPIPATSKLLQSPNKIDFCDAYQVSVSNVNVSVQGAYAALFGYRPWWMRALLGIRGAAARCVGLEHSALGQFQIPLNEDAYRVGCRVGMFDVRSIEPHELVVGRNDKHLDVRISFLKSSVDEVATITVSTVVETHNTLGRIYMLFVGPVHGFLVPLNMRKLLAAGRL